WLNVVFASCLIRSVARVAASISTPESAYEIGLVMICFEFPGGLPSLRSLLNYGLWWWSKITVRDKPRSRRIILLSGASGKQIFPRLFCNLDRNVAFFPSGCDRNFALHVCAVKFDVSCSQTIQNTLGRVTITIPGPARHKCDS